MGATKQGWEKRRLNGKGIAWNKGLTKLDPRVAQYSIKHGLAMKGRKLTQAHKDKIGKKSKGHTLSIEARRKISDSKLGPKSHFWKGGVTEINKVIRESLQYRLWRESVYLRDDYVCQTCGQRGGNLNADHIKPFALFPELRFELSNGRTLCHSCHKKTETFGRTYTLDRKRDANGQYASIA